MPAPAAPFPLKPRLHLALYALVFTAVSGFAYTDDNLSPLLFVLFACLLAWFLVDSPPRTPPLPLPAAFDFKDRGAPKSLLNVIVLLAASYLWYEVTGDTGSQNLILSLSHFILALLLCKLMERKTPRDIAQILVLSLLIVVASAMFSSSGLFYALLLALYFGLLFYVILLVNLDRELSLLPPAGVALAALPRNGSLALLRRDLRLSAKQCFLLVLPVAVIVFLAVPRTRASALSAPWSVGAYQTGFTDTVQFHDYGQLSQSDTIVMTAWLTRGYDADYKPIKVTSEFNDLYFRGQVLTQYNPENARWEHVPADTAGLDTTKLAVPPTPDDILEDFDLQAPTGRLLFCIGPIRPPADPSLYYFNPRTMTLMAATARPVGKLHYQLQWSPNAAPLPEPASLDPGLLRPARPLAPPVMVSPEITELAQRLAKQFLTPIGTIPPENIRNVITLYETYLKSTYPYSLSFRQVDRSKDPTTDFLLNRKQTGGHCEYFASAMVMMCRAVGLNARMVTGFHGGEYNSIDNTLIIRQKDAHAWAEVYVPDAGWVTTDPTPPSRAADAGVTFLGRWAHDITSVFQNLWLSVFVSFDNDSRHAIGQWVTGKLSFLSEFATSAFWKWLITDFWGLFGILGLALTSWWTIRRWRKDPRIVRGAVVSAALRSATRHSAQLAFLDSLLHLFENPRHLRTPDQTPLEFLRPHLQTLGPAADDAHWLIKTAYSIRFGNLHLDADLRGQIALALRRVKTALPPHV